MGSPSVLYARIDVALARDPRMIAAGPMARLLYVQAVLYCRENLTDGVIDRLVLPLIAVDIPAARKHIERLVDVGALQEAAVGWNFPPDVWRRYNPLRSEVDEMRDSKRESARESGSFGNHKRWHLERGEQNPDCRYCIANGSPPDHTDPIATRSGRDRESSQAEAETETKAEKNSLSSSRSITGVVAELGERFKDEAIGRVDRP